VEISETFETSETSDGDEHEEEESEFAVHITRILFVTDNVLVVIAAHITAILPSAVAVHKS
jgi:hypothetical protein